ncbi:hypothetical protein HK100_002892, partial [Physocladia obscura]
MVKEAEAHHDYTGCKLDLDRIEEHAQHFKMIFGAELTGKLDVDLQAELVPHACSWATEDIINLESVKHAITWLDNNQGGFWLLGSALDQAM